MARYINKQTAMVLVSFPAMYQVEDLLLLWWEEKRLSRLILGIDPFLIACFEKDVYTLQPLLIFLHDYNSFLSKLHLWTWCTLRQILSVLSRGSKITIHLTKIGDARRGFLSPWCILSESRSDWPQAISPRKVSELPLQRFPSLHSMRP